MVEVVMVPRDRTVQELVNLYAEGELTYNQLLKEFSDRGWSTVSLYENVRHINPKKKGATDIAQH